nr:MAG TPA: Prokaryotic membrane lipoprotein lipid attachment site [Caudoviricetes sp.]
MNKKYLLPLLALFLCGCIGNKQIVDTTTRIRKQS